MPRKTDRNHPPPDFLEGDRQLSDPVELAAGEDQRSVPEQLMFDPDVDDLGEMLGEEYVRAVTSGEEQGVEMRDEELPEEMGGPFVETSPRKEFGFDVDDSNPEDAEREPLPLANRVRTKNQR
jgi:hypothetical protein